MKLGTLPPAYQTQARQQTGGLNEMEGEFYQLWLMLGGDPLVSQHRAIPGRRFAIDFCHLAVKVAIELEGGIWMKTKGGRGKGHANPKRFISDCEKYNLLALDGWIVFRLATGMVTPAHIEPIVAFVSNAIDRMQEV